MARMKFRVFNLVDVKKVDEDSESSRIKNAKSGERWRFQVTKQIIAACSRTLLS